MKTVIILLIHCLFLSGKCLPSENLAFFNRIEGGAVKVTVEDGFHLMTCETSKSFQIKFKDGEERFLTSEWKPISSKMSMLVVYSESGAGYIRSRAFTTHESGELTLIVDSIKRERVSFFFFDEQHPLIGEARDGETWYWDWEKMQVRNITGHTLPSPAPSP